MAPRPGVWWVYVLRRGDGALYTGIATDVARRLAEHQSGRGAKALRGRGPLDLLLARKVGERGHAQRVERAIQRLPKVAKEALVLRRRLLTEIVRRAASLSSSP
jgi:putative endonuclease